MKKRNLLIPIVSLSAIATGMGATVSCSSDNAIHLKTYKDYQSEAGKTKLLYQQVETMDKGLYTVVVDLNGFWEPDQSKPERKFESYFTIRDNVDSEATTATFDNEQIWYDGTKLDKVDNMADLGPNKYWLDAEESHSIRVGKGTVKTGKEKVKIKFNLLESVENYYVCFFGPLVEPK